MRTDENLSIFDYLSRFQVGQRVRFTEEFILEFPMDGRVAKDAMGTIASIENDPEGGDRYMMVKLDDHIDALDDWNNELQLWQWDNEPGATVYDIEVVS